MFTQLICYQAYCIAYIVKINDYSCFTDFLLRTVHHSINTVITVYSLISALIKLYGVISLTIAECVAQDVQDTRKLQEIGDTVL